MNLNPETKMKMDPEKESLFWMAIQNNCAAIIIIRIPGVLMRSLCRQNEIP